MNKPLQKSITWLSLINILSERSQLQKKEEEKQENRRGKGKRGGRKEGGKYMVQDFTYVTFKTSKATL